jgi:Lrp/AsnC family leucine-responsive transcriptional regulator
MKQTRVNVLEELNQAFNQTVKEVPEIQSCLLLAGQFDYLLKVHTQGIIYFRILLGERIKSTPHFLQTHLFAVMASVTDTCFVQITASVATHLDRRDRLAV